MLSFIRESARVFPVIVQYSERYNDKVKKHKEEFVILLKGYQIYMQDRKQDMHKDETQKSTLFHCNTPAVVWQ